MADDPTIISSLSATLAIEYGVEIDPTIVTKIPFDSPMYDWLEMGHPPIKKLGKAAVYGLLTAADFTASNDGSFAAGGDPPGITTTRSLSSVTKKSYGALAGIKDVDIIASSMGIAPHSVTGLGSYADDAEFLLNLLYVRTRQALDYAIVKGNTGSSVNQFDGIETKVVSGTSQVLDVSGSYTKAKLDELIIDMMTKGIVPSAVACNPAMLSSIVQAYVDNSSRVSINMNMGDGAATLGHWAKSIMTPAGELPIITDRRFTVSGTAPTFTGDIFVLTKSHMGEPVLYLEWQVTPVALDLARVPGFYTSQVFAVWCHTVLVEKTDWWAQGKLDDVVVTYAPTPETVNP